MFIQSLQTKTLNIKQSKGNPLSIGIFLYKLQFNKTNNKKPKLS